MASYRLKRKTFSLFSNKKLLFGLSAALISSFFLLKRYFHRKKDKVSNISDKDLLDLKNSNKSSINEINSIIPFYSKLSEKILKILDNTSKLYVDPEIGEYLVKNKHIINDLSLTPILLNPKKILDSLKDNKTWCDVLILYGGGLIILYDIGDNSWYFKDGTYNPPQEFKLKEGVDERTLFKAISLFYSEDYDSFLKNKVESIENSKVKTAIRSCLLDNIKILNS